MRSNPPRFSRVVLSEIIHNLAAAEFLDALGECISCFLWLHSNVWLCSVGSFSLNFVGVVCANTWLHTGSTRDVSSVLEQSMAEMAVSSEWKLFPP